MPHILVSILSLGFFQKQYLLRIRIFDLFLDYFIFRDLFFYYLFAKNFDNFIFLEDILNQIIPNLEHMQFVYVQMSQFVSKTARLIKNLVAIRCNSVKINIGQRSAKQLICNQQKNKIFDPQYLNSFVRVYDLILLQNGYSDFDSCFQSLSKKIVKN